MYAYNIYIHIWNQNVKINVVIVYLFVQIHINSICSFSSITNKEIIMKLFSCSMISVQPISPSQQQQQYIAAKILCEHENVWRYQQRMRTSPILIAFFSSLVGRHFSFREENNKIGVAKSKWIFPLIVEYSNLRTNDCVLDGLGVLLAWHIKLQTFYSSDKTITKWNFVRENGKKSNWNSF